MKIEGNTIIFKSTPENYYNEFCGFKSNTVRRICIPEEVKEFIIFKRNLNVNSKVHITTKFNSGDSAEFERYITDITWFEGYNDDGSGVWIISWNPSEVKK